MSVKTLSMVVQPGDDVLRAHALEERIHEWIHDMAARFLYLGQLLYQFDRARAWELLGYGSFKDWCDHSGKCPIGYRSATAAKRAWWLMVEVHDRNPEELEAVGEARFQTLTSAIGNSSGDLVHLWEAEQRAQDTLQELAARLEDEDDPGMREPLEARMRELEEEVRATRQELDERRRELEPKVNEWLEAALSLSKRDLSERAAEAGETNGMMSYTSVWVQVRSLSKFERERLSITDLPDEFWVRVSVTGFRDGRPPGEE